MVDEEPLSDRQGHPSIVGGRYRRLGRIAMALAVQEGLGLLHLEVHLFAAGVEEGAEGTCQGGDDEDRPEVEDQLEELAEVRGRVGDRGAGEELRGGEEEGVEERWISVPFASCSVR
jgi:hypothetical protein